MAPDGDEATATVSSPVPRSGDAVATTRHKAKILVEALTYMKAYSGRTVVIKLGGAAMVSPDLLDAFAEDVALMRLVGIRPVVVHGGGPQISELMIRLGLEPRFEDGYRVTDSDVLEATAMALVGKVNRSIVGAINRHGDVAVGLSGEDANMLVTEKKLGPSGSDLGLVGNVVEVRTAVLSQLLDDGFVPVVAPLGRTRTGQTHNVNADEAAGAIAEAIGAEKLVFLTDVAGLYEDFGQQDSLLSEVSLEYLEEMLSSKKLSEGMVPKVASCIRALKGGVRRAHILDGRVEHAVLLEVFTPEGIGTMVTAPGSPTEKEFRALHEPG
jgi:acetylglutamate kinase